MIKINLLPKREIKRDLDIRIQAIVLLGILFVIVALSVSAGFHLSSKVRDLEVAKKAKETELKKYDDIVKKVAETEKKVAAVNKKIQVVKSVSVYRSAVIRSLDQVVLSVIPNRMYLRTLSHSRDTITMEGTAKNHDVVAEFMEKLKTQPDITSVFLKNATLKPAQDDVGELVDFAIVCDTVYKPKPVQAQPAHKGDKGK